MSDSPELLKPNAEVTDSELQNELGNLKAENEKLQTELGNLGNFKTENENLRADYAALLESSTHVTNKLRQEVQELQSQLDAEKKRVEEVWEELEDSQEARENLRSENLELQKTCTQLQSELVDLKQKSAPAEKNFPDAADVLNQLKAKRKKSKTDLADLEFILEILEG
ncbi:hypothetical protein Q5692_33705 [Microcoleus sp. C2C3]|uniref:hypothetical protein n=1 Tax=unclassified Microcoleus TaxID=2642155 RepID=UPI002FD5D88A